MEFSANRWQGGYARSHSFSLAYTLTSTSHSADTFPLFFFFPTQNEKQMKETKHSELLVSAKWSWRASSFPLSHLQAAVPKSKVGNAKPVRILLWEQTQPGPGDRAVGQPRAWRGVLWLRRLRTKIKQASMGQSHQNPLIPRRLNCY